MLGLTKTGKGEHSHSSCVPQLPWGGGQQVLTGKPLFTFALLGSGRKVQN